jgi:hypothetical protein
MPVRSGQPFSSALLDYPLGCFSPRLSSPSTVPTAAIPPATAAAFAAFFAVRLILERVSEADRAFVFVALFFLVLPCFVALAPEPFDDFFEVRFAAFAMLSPSASWV